jgi:hypothetical protein
MGTSKVSTNDQLLLLPNSDELFGRHQLTILWQFCDTSNHPQEEFRWVQVRERKVEKLKNHATFSK